MGLFDFLRGPNINAGVEKYKSAKGAVLLDVRTEEEFAQGHIQDAVNIPLQEISKVTEQIADKSTPLFTYCLSGARSTQASVMIKQMGYTNVINIGGISSYRGKVVK